MLVTIYTIIFLISFFGMEFMAWFTHKYVMHGFMWNLHSDHHTGSEGKIEKNDWFSLIFAIPSGLFIWGGCAYQNYYVASIGFGMTAYGIAYFFVHDIFIHQRIKLFRNLDTNYFRAIRRAHKMHHKHLSKENGESFGFLIVSLKYFKQDKNAKLNN
ncbi:MAG: sterol desaturase family protein [Bacteroidetes bacterium]|nr:sterol desaturase family protein [Bacteroidota bacterium]